MDDARIVERWKNYYSSLLNEEFPRSIHTTELPVQAPVRQISESEMIEGLKRMKKGKSVGPDNIPIEFWIACGNIGMKFLRIIFNRMLQGETMPQSFRKVLLFRFIRTKATAASAPITVELN